MGLLDDTALFAAIVQQGGFSHAAKHLGLSNGLISRRIAQLESQLGVTLIKRTTRQLHLTPEGELFWQHAQRIQQELDSALSLIHSLAEKPKGEIRISAPVSFGKHYLVPILNKFLDHFDNIKIDLILTDQRLDPVKENIDLLIRGAGYLNKPILKDSSMKMKLLVMQKIGLYASPEYLMKHGEPKTADLLLEHKIIGFTDKIHASNQEEWEYQCKEVSSVISLTPQFICNDMDSRLMACIAGHGIGKFTELAVRQVGSRQLLPVLQQYDWGSFNLFAVYAQQQALPKRTRLLLEYIVAHTKNLIEKVTE